MKEYNVKKHYTMRHSNIYEKIKGQVRKDNFGNLKKSVKTQQSLYLKLSIDTISNAKLRFKIKDAIAKGRWSFGNGKLI